MFEVWRKVSLAITLLGCAFYLYIYRTNADLAMLVLSATMLYMMSFLIIKAVVTGKASTRLGFDVDCNTNPSMFYFQLAAFVLIAMMFFVMGILTLLGHIHFHARA